MSDYIKITDYAAKDALLTGNPAKLVKGTEIGADFDAVAVAVATKYDSTDARLADVAGLTPTDNGVIIGNGANFVVESGATLKTSLGLTIGTDVQAYDADTTKNDVANTFTAQQSFTGTAATAPAIAGASDPNTGVFFPAADTVAVATGGSERMRIDTSGNVTLGNSAPSLLSEKLNITGTGLVIEASDGGITSFLGTFGGSDVICGAYSANSVSFRSGNAERLRINNSTGDVLATSPAGLGYGTGAGGTVTQATSKATAVTLNKPTGLITMNNEALAAGASVIFALVNSVIAATDVLIPTANFSGGNYRAETVYTTTGTGYIKVTNTSAGSLSDALVINFAIIKGSAT